VIVSIVRGDAVCPLTSLNTQSSLSCLTPPPWFLDFSSVSWTVAHFLATPTRIDTNDEVDVTDATKLPVPRLRGLSNYNGWIYAHTHPSSSFRERVYPSRVSESQKILFLFHRPPRCRLSSPPLFRNSHVPIIIIICFVVVLVAVLIIVIELFDSSSFGCYYLYLSISITAKNTFLFPRTALLSR
jgi:hypothetical protein